MTSKPKPVGIKETLTSLTIAFMMAFVFRGFVIEGFIIPTGSMAPTLLGKHVRFESPYSGYDWATGPWDYASFASNQPLPRQGGQTRGQSGRTPPLTPTDPMTMLDIPSAENRRLAAGDRVFVLKYLPGLHHPERWDVVVFKNPSTHENYIKRLVGLPGEQMAIVDGDIFVRPYVPGQTATEGREAWEAADWTIARKSERTQREMFQPIFDTRYTPLTPEPSYRPPLAPSNPGSWSGVDTESVWSYTGSGPTELRWTNRRPITDSDPYNQDDAGDRLDVRPDDLARRGERPYPVCDLAISVAVEPGDAPIVVTPTIEALGMVFQGVVDADSSMATVRMRPENDPEAWTVLNAESFSGLNAGRTSVVEFWHVDQTLWLFIDGDLVAGGPEQGAYKLSPAQRLGAAMVPSWDDLVANTDSGDGVSTAGVFARQELYRQSTPSIAFSGGPFTVHRTEIQRDIAYRPANGIQPSRGAHFNNFPTLASDQFFMCGDNSARSEDSRFWTAAGMDPWVRDLIDPTPGVVSRDLIVGKAFVVYFPAPLDGGPVLAPDIGRVRWIW